MKLTKIKNIDDQHLILYFDDEILGEIVERVTVPAKITERIAEASKVLADEVSLIDFYISQFLTILVSFGIETVLEIDKELQEFREPILEHEK